MIEAAVDDKASRSVYGYVRTRRDQVGLHGNLKRAAPSGIRIALEQVSDQYRRLVSQSAIANTGSETRSNSEALPCLKYSFGGLFSGVKSYLCWMDILWLLQINKGGKGC